MIPNERTVSIEITDNDVKEAVRLKSSACFYTVTILHALGGGSDSGEWWLATNFTLKDLVEKAIEQKIDFTGIVNLDNVPVESSMKYLHAIGKITDTELKYWWRGVKNGTIEPDGTIVK